MTRLLKVKISGLPVKTPFRQFRGIATVRRVTSFGDENHMECRIIEGERRKPYPSPCRMDRPFDRRRPFEFCCSRGGGKNLLRSAHAHKWDSHRGYQLVPGQAWLWPRGFRRSAG